MVAETAFGLPRCMPARMQKNEAARDETEIAHGVCFQGLSLCNTTSNHSASIQSGDLECGGS
jgi:hypothetical protein